jgi:hypothetical protein
MTDYENKPPPKRLFSRERRADWCCWGDELDRFPSVKEWTS